MKDLRNAFHIFIGFSIGYFSLLLFGFNTYNFPLDYEHITNFSFPIISGLIGLIVGFLWERYQETKLGLYSDMKDAYRTAFGGFVGGITEMIYGNWILAIALIAVSIFIVIKFYKK